MFLKILFLCSLFLCTFNEILITSNKSAIVYNKDEGELQNESYLRRKHVDDFNKTKASWKTILNNRRNNGLNKYGKLEKKVADFGNRDRGHENNKQLSNVHDWEKFVLKEEQEEQQKQVELENVGKNQKQENENKLLVPFKIYYNRKVPMDTKPPDEIADRGESQQRNIKEKPVKIENSEEKEVISFTYRNQHLRYESNFNNGPNSPDPIDRDNIQKSTFEMEELPEDISNTEKYGKKYRTQEEIITPIFRTNRPLVEKENGHKIRFKNKNRESFLVSQRPIIYDIQPRFMEVPLDNIDLTTFDYHFERKFNLKSDHQYPTEMEPVYEIERIDRSNIDTDGQIVQNRPYAEENDVDSKENVENENAQRTLIEYEGITPDIDYAFLDMTKDYIIYEDELKKGNKLGTVYPFEVTPKFSVKMDKTHFFTKGFGNRQEEYNDELLHRKFLTKLLDDKVTARRLYSYDQQTTKYKDITGKFAQKLVTQSKGYKTARTFQKKIVPEVIFMSPRSNHNYFRSYDNDTQPPLSDRDLVEISEENLEKWKDIKGKVHFNPTSLYGKKRTLGAEDGTKLYPFSEKYLYKAHQEGTDDKLYRDSKENDTDFKGFVYRVYEDLKTKYNQPRNIIDDNDIPSTKYGKKLLITTIQSRSIASKSFDKKIMKNPTPKEDNMLPTVNLKKIKNKFRKNRDVPAKNSTMYRISQNHTNNQAEGVNKNLESKPWESQRALPILKEDSKRRKETNKILKKDKTSTAILLNNAIDLKQNNQTSIENSTILQKPIMSPSEHLENTTEHDNPMTKYSNKLFIQSIKSLNKSRKNRDIPAKNYPTRKNSTMYRISQNHINNKAEGVYKNLESKPSEFQRAQPILKEDSSKRRKETYKILKDDKTTSTIFLNNGTDLKLNNHTSNKNSTILQKYIMSPSEHLENTTEHNILTTNYGNKLSIKTIRSAIASKCFDKKSIKNSTTKKHIMLSTISLNKIKNNKPLAPIPLNKSRKNRDVLRKNYPTRTNTRNNQAEGVIKNFESVLLESQRAQPMLEEDDKRKKETNKILKKDINNSTIPRNNGTGLKHNNQINNDNATILRKLQMFPLELLEDSIILELQNQSSLQKNCQRNGKNFFLELGREKTALEHDNQIKYEIIKRLEKTINVSPELENDSPKRSKIKKNLITQKYLPEHQSSSFLKDKNQKSKVNEKIQRGNSSFLFGDLRKREVIKHKRKHKTLNILQSTPIFLSDLLENSSVFELNTKKNHLTRKLLPGNTKSYSALENNSSILEETLKEKHRKRKLLPGKIEVEAEMEYRTKKHNNSFDVEHKTKKKSHRKILQRRKTILPVLQNHSSTFEHNAEDNYRTKNMLQKITKLLPALQTPKHRIKKTHRKFSLDLEHNTKSTSLPLEKRKKFSVINYLKKIDKIQKLQLKNGTVPLKLEEHSTEEDTFKFSNKGKQKGEQLTEEGSVEFHNKGNERGEEVFKFHIKVNQRDWEEQITEKNTLIFHIRGNQRGESVEDLSIEDKEDRDNNNGSNCLENQQYLPKNLNLQSEYRKKRSLLGNTNNLQSNGNENTMTLSGIRKNQSEDLDCFDATNVDKQHRAHGNVQKKNNLNSTEMKQTSGRNVESGIQRYHNNFEELKEEGSHKLNNSSQIEKRHLIFQDALQLQKLENYLRDNKGKKSMPRTVKISVSALNMDKKLRELHSIYEKSGNELFSKNLTNKNNQKSLKNYMVQRSIKKILPNDNSAFILLDSNSRRKRQIQKKEHNMELGLPKRSENHTEPNVARQNKSKPSKMEKYPNQNLQKNEIKFQLRQKRESHLEEYYVGEYIYFRGHLDRSYSGRYDSERYVYRERPVYSARRALVFRPGGRAVIVRPGRPGMVGRPGRPGVVGRPGRPPVIVRPHRPLVIVRPGRPIVVHRTYGWRPLYTYITIGVGLAVIGIIVTVVLCTCCACFYTAFACRHNRGNEVNPVYFQPTRQTGVW